MNLLSNLNKIKSLASRVIANPSQSQLYNPVNRFLSERVAKPVVNFLGNTISQNYKNTVEAQKVLQKAGKVGWSNLSPDERNFVINDAGNVVFGLVDAPKSIVRPKAATNVIKLSNVDPTETLLAKAYKTPQTAPNAIQLKAGVKELNEAMARKAAAARETTERLFRESTKGKNIAPGLLSESSMQTKFRRNLGLAPEDVYQTNQSVKQQFRAFSRVSPTNVIPDVNKLKDISSTERGFKDVYRIFEKVFKKDFPSIKQTVLDPFDSGKKLYTEMINDYSNGLKKNIVDLGIKKGSKESAAVQLFGEGKLNFQQLIQKFGKEKADKITKADKWFRQTYDELLDIVNSTRRQLYPNNPEMIIPHRKDYYRHFQELNGVEGLKNIFETSAGIDPKMVGISDFTLPRSKWLPFAQRRIGDSTKYDAVGGFLDYLPKAAYASQIDPHILQFRKLASEVVQKTGQAGEEEYKTLNNFIEFLEDYGNDLAGKTNPLDRGIQKYIPGGRKTFRLIDWANKRVKANTILGNVSSSIAQAANLPQGAASARPDRLLAGMVDTVLSPLRKSNIVDQSGFIAERYLKTSRFDRGIVNDVKKFAVWMTGALDEFGTKSIWNAHYKKAIAQSIENPIKYADDITRKLVAGRGIGEVPLVQKSKVFQMVAPFQLEVANLWHIMGDNVSNKEFGKLAQLLFYNWVFNSVAEPIVGRRITFDPIDAVLDSLSDEESRTPLGIGGRLSGEVLSNLPFGQTVAALYPEYGFSIGENQLPTRQKLFGESDPTRFGGGMLVNKGLQDPLYKLLPPFGGNQLKKTIQGVQALSEGGSYSPKGAEKFEVEATPLNVVKSVLFGPYGTKEGTTYAQNLGKSKSELLFNKLKTLTPEQLNAEIDYLEDNDPATARALEKYILDRKLKITSREKQIRTLPVKDGSRSRSIIKLMRSKATPQEKADLYSRLDDLGIISKEVEEQLAELIQAGALK